MLVKLFEHKVRQAPDKVIVKARNKELTYKDLNKYANAVAYEIKRIMEISQASCRAALLFEHGADILTGTLGALKADCIYVPFDPTYPENRLLYMLDNSEAQLIITNNTNYELAQRLQNKANITLKLINIDEINNNTILTDPERKADEDKIAYILYTSGSSGLPKGIVQTHGNILHFVNCYIKNLNIKETDKMTLFSSFSHDAAVMDIYSCLLSGAVLYPMNIREQANMEALADWLSNERITIWHSVPTLFRYFVNTLTGRENLNNIRHIVLGGEAVIEHDIISFKKHFHDNAVLVNLYGQSESSYNSTLFITKDASPKLITLGEPVDDTEILVINDDGEEVEPLSTGEIVIAGRYIAKGYWRNETKTKDSFGFDPDLGNLYWTGDLGRLTEDGRIEFLGRKDYQIKVRGNRVELGEIETKLLSSNKLKEAAVLGKEDKLGEKYLCAYIAANEQYTGNKASLIEELKEYLSKDLPDYMMPSYFMCLDKLPQTPNGKLDRAALAALVIEEKSKLNRESYEAPRNITEERLAMLWTEVLGVERISINDSFFELGGHSLKAAQLLTKIHREFNIEIPLRAIFTAPTIKGISELINTKDYSIHYSIQPLNKEHNCLQALWQASSAQKRIFTLQQLDSNSTSYNMPAVFEIEGILNKQRLKEAINKLIRRHEILRTSFVLTEEGLMQEIHEEAELELEIIDRSLSVDKAVKQFIRAFDLTRVPLLRVGLIKLSDHQETIKNQESLPKQQHVLLLDIHHIISDGTSIGILIEEFAKAYSGEELSELKIQYKDFAHWQNQLLRSDKIQEQASYWLKGLGSGELPVLNLPTDYPRPAVQSFEGRRTSFEINKETTAALRRLTRETNTTIYMLLLAAYNVLLHKYSSQEDIIVGSPIAGRSHDDLQELIGMFVNTLPMRCFPQRYKTFREFLMEVKETALRAHENQDYQFEELVEQLNLKRDMSRNPIFDVVFVLQNMEFRQAELQGISIKQSMLSNDISKFDITLTAMELKDTIEMTLEYSTRLFKTDTILRLCGHFTNILNEIAKDMDKRLHEIQILAHEEKQQLLLDFNNTQMEYSINNTIYQMFEEQVKKTPHNIAVVSGGCSITYKTLNEKSNQLAKLLRDKGVNSETVVGILTEPSIEMIIGILGIQKSGGAYLPIDSTYPKERIEYILADSRAKLLLIQNALKNISCLAESDIDIINLDDEELYCGSKEDLQNINKASDMAYVIYTSGSTGKPKGVVIEHSSLINMCMWYKSYYELSETDRGTKYAAFGFDASVWEIFPYLITGASIYMIEEDIKLDMEALNEFYEQNGITISFLPTQICEQFMLRDNKSLRYLLTGGDELKKYTKTSYTVVNNYGPTESTIVATSHILNSKYDETDTPIAIGTPIANTQIYIIDKDNNLQPIGVPGELCISGAGLARGYLNKPELTAERFVSNPFVERNSVNNSIMYRTGDLARWMPDGNIEFLGRIDYQTKIRGYRIELGEIESKLLSHGEILEAVVIARENETGSKYLCTYFTAKRELNKQELKEYLRKELPEYMIPGGFMQLSNMPLTPNRLVDRRALAEDIKYSMDNEIALAATEYEAPSSDTEKILAAVWMEVLGADKIGISDSFFMYGGDSIKAIQVCTRLQRYNMKLEVRHLLQNSTIREATKYIMPFTPKLKQNKLRDIEEAELVKEVLKEYGIEQDAVEDMYPLSPMQEGMLFHVQLKNDLSVYFQQISLELEGEINIDIFEECFNHMLNSYDVLRTLFVYERVTKPIQVVLKQAKGKVEYFDITMLSISEKEKYINEFKAKDKERGFDLSKELPIRVYILKLESQSFMIIWSFHHIIIDGWCLKLIMRDFTACYADIKKGRTVQLKKSTPYSGYIEWLAEQDTEEAAAYWKEYLRGYEQTAVIPVTSSKANNEYEDKEKVVSLNREYTKSLIKLSRQWGVTLNTVMQAVWGVLLQSYNNTDDVVFGTVVSGRPAEITGIEEMVGLFINTIPVRLKTNKEENNIETFAQAVKELQKQAVETAKYEHTALAHVQTNSMLKQNLIDNLLVFENYPIESKLADNMNIIDSIGFKVHSARAAGHTSYNFNFIIAPAGDELVIKIGYNGKIYDDEQVERIIGNIQQVIASIIINPDIKLRDIDILSREEKEKLLKEFNNTAVEYPYYKAIHQIFEEQVQRTPDNIAVVFDDEASFRKTLTYRELNDKADKLANVLKNRYIKPDNTSISAVAIMVDNSLEMLIGIMGILKSGCAYLPIDHKYPKDRIIYMLEDSGVNILLTQTWLEHKLEYGKEILLLDDEALYSDNDAYQEPHRNQEEINKSTTAYIIYTSGSTGRPKGVVVGHHALINMSLWYKDYYKLRETDRATKYAGFGFDASVWEIFPALIAGAAIYIINDHIKLDINKLNKYYEANMITHSFLPTQICEQFMAVDNKSLKYLATGGDKLKQYLDTSYTVVNNYGPTENTVVATSYIVDRCYDNIPIGRPIANTQIYITDRYNKLQPIGAPGELCISGASLAEGYLNKPSLTAERFVSNPFVQASKENKPSLIYRTGDLARWLPDGNIEFLGRIDEQVKIRGYRIELGEIEGQLLSHPEINSAAVVAKEGKSGNQYLCAYLSANKEVEELGLKGYLGEKLPDYMIPKVFVRLEKIPVTPNGKIDKKHLLSLEDENQSETEGQRARSRIEDFLVEEICKVMSLDTIGINDNLFDKGASSLDIMKITQRIRDKYEIDYNYVFKYPYISEIAKKVKEKLYDTITHISMLKGMYGNDAPQSNARDKIQEEYKHYIARSEAECSSFDLSQTTNYKNILLAGATGYLGIYLAKDILEMTDCDLTVIIRGKSVEEALDKLKKKLKFYFDKDIYNTYRSRIKVYNGDLTEFMLGLDSIQYADLISSIDCVINTAANVKHFGLYEEFYKANVGITQNLLSLCTKADKKDYFHVSTTSIASGYIENKEVQLFTEYECDLGQSTENYYINTKLEAEKVVLKAREEGINTTIFRMGNLVFDSQTGRGQENIGDNAFYQIAKCLLKLRSIPNETNKYAEFTFIDSASKAVILLFNKTELKNQVYHVNNINLVRYDDFLDLTSDIGVKLELLDIVDFLDALITHYNNPSLKDFVDTLLIHTEMLDEKKHTSIVKASDRTNRILNSLGFYWDKITKEHLNKMFAYGFKIGYFE